MKKIRFIYKNISKPAFWSTFTISVMLLVTSFFLPPTGQVDPSVCGAVGELFAFGCLATVIDGLHKGTDVTISKGDLNVSLQNPDQQPGKPEE